MNLEKLARHFFSLYSRRNRIFLPGLRERVDFLNLAIGDLQDAIRKDYGSRAIGMALARGVSRIFCITEHFKEFPFVEFMARKYPATHCNYCQQWPCTCAERRPDAILTESALPEQLNWSLGDWCEYFQLLYGAPNRARGIENILNRLFKEVSELLSLSMRVQNGALALPIEKIEEEFALELADALAWTIAVADCLGINLEQAVLERYESGCSKCRMNPCHCTYFSMAPVDWKIFIAESPTSSKPAG